MKNRNYDVWLNIGLNILHYRKEQGMTQMQLAEKSNISKNHMQRIETAACSCTLDTLIDIADALNIPLKKLFEFRDEKTQKDYGINSIVLLYIAFLLQKP